MSAPQAVNPHYLGSSRSNPRENENPLVTFWKTQVVAPEHRADNLTILRAATLFIAGVAFFRSDLGNVIVPAF